MLTLKPVNEWEKGWSKKSLTWLRRTSGLYDTVQGYINDLQRKLHPGLTAMPHGVLKLNIEALSFQAGSKGTPNPFGCSQDEVENWINKN